MPQLASVGNGIWVGNFHACGLKPFRTVHIWHEKQNGVCEFVQKGDVGHQELNYQNVQHLVINYLEGSEVPVLEMERIWYWVQMSPADIFVHCAAGMARSTCFCVIAKVVRGCDRYQALADIAKGVWEQYEIKVSPHFHTHIMTPIFRWLDTKLKNESHT